MKQTIIKIGDMHCASCSSRIEKALNQTQGVERAVVNLATLKATITFDEKLVTVEELVEVITRLGYTPEASKQVIKRAFKIEGMT